MGRIKYQVSGIKTWGRKILEGVVNLTTFGLEARTFNLPATNLDT